MSRKKELKSMMKQVEQTNHGKQKEQKRKRKQHGKADVEHAVQKRTMNLHLSARPWTVERKH